MIDHSQYHYLCSPGPEVDHSALEARILELKAEYDKHKVSEDKEKLREAAVVEIRQLINTR